MSLRKLRLVSSLLFQNSCFFLFALFSASNVNCGEISGTVIDHSTGTPITDATIAIYATTGSKCSSTIASGVVVNDTNGTYTLSLSAANTYYLWAHVTGNSNYFDEWWANSVSNQDCNNAEGIVMAESDVLTGKDFQLDRGATISGTIYSSDSGNPISNGDNSLTIHPYTGDPCNSPIRYTAVNNAIVDSQDGTFTLGPLPPDDYYLKTTSTNQSLVDEWWDSPYSRFDCDRATSIFVEEGDGITGKDFQLLDKEPEVGNINMDSSVDLADAILALQGLTSQPSERIWLEGDTNLDDQIGMADILYLLLLLSGSNP